MLSSAYKLLRSEVGPSFTVEVFFQMPATHGASNKPLKTRVDDDFVSIFLTSDFKHVDGQPVSDLLI